MQVMTSATHSSTRRVRIWPSSKATFTFYSLLNNLHASLSNDDFFNRLEQLILHLGWSNRFALLFRDEGTGGLYVVRKQGFGTIELESIKLALESKFPLDKIQLRDDIIDCPLTVGNLVFEETVFGLMLLAGSRNQDSKDTHEQTVVLYDAIGIALVKLQILEEANKNKLVAIEKNNAINRVADVLRNKELDALLANLLNISLGIMKGQVGNILLGETDGSLMSRCEMGLPTDLFLSLKDRKGQSFVKHVMAQSESTLIQDAINDDRIDLSECQQHIRSIICLRLAIKTKCLGILVIVNADDCFDQSGFEVLCTITHLAASAIENALLRVEQITSNRIRQQIFLARQIQESLQAKYIPQRNEVDLDGWCLSCDETGGDYYDFLEVGADKVGLIVGDASGHGLGAALTMIAVRASLLSLIAQEYPLTEVFRLVNNRMEADGHADQFMTLFCGFFDVSSKTLTYCSAGHDSPLLYRPSEDRILELEATGIPLGMFSDWQYEIKETEQLQRGDILLISTDGLREAFNEHREAFGDERLQRIVRESAGLSAQEIGSKLRSSVLEFIAASPRSDDITVVVAVIR